MWLESSPAPFVTFKYPNHYLLYTMAAGSTIQKIYEELKGLKEDVTFIKKHMFDADTIMTTEDAKRFEESMGELKEGKTTPLSELKEELGL